MRKGCVDCGLLRSCERSWIRHQIGRIKCPYLNRTWPRIVGSAEWHRGKEGVKLSGHHQSLPPMEGALGAQEALQHMFKVATQEAYAFEVWAFVICCRYIDTNKIDNFIVGDGCVHS
jgi:hypothetical protein